MRRTEQYAMVMICLQGQNSETEQ